MPHGRGLEFGGIHGPGLCRGPQLCRWAAPGPSPRTGDEEAADKTPSGTVSLLLLDREKVESICAWAAEAGEIQIANYLCPGNLVLSGEKAACAKAEELANQEGGRAVPLTVAGAFHLRS